MIRLSLAIVLGTLSLIAAPRVAAGDAPNWQFRLTAGTTRTLAGDRSLAASIGAQRRLPDYRWAGGDLSLDLGLYSLRQRDTDDPLLDRDVIAAAAGLRWRRGNLVLGFSPAIATSRTSAISGVLQFVSTIGLQGRRLGLMLQHMSNASLNGDNDGETMLMLEWQL